MPTHLTPVALNRSIQSDVWFERLRRIMLDVLNSFYLETAERVASGFPPQDRASAWTRRLVDAKRPIYMGMVRAGGELATIEFAKGKQLDPSFDLDLEVRNIEAYLLETSRIETATTAKRIAASLEAGAAEDLAPRALAKKLVADGAVTNAARARLLARTGTIWAYNEGAHITYKRAGVAVEEWLATADDRTCEFCLQLDGQKVRTADDFVPEGTKLQGILGGSLNIPLAVNHPPLHPHCRCTMVPVLDGSPVSRQSPIVPRKPRAISKPQTKVWNRWAGGLVDEERDAFTAWGASTRGLHSAAEAARANPERFNAFSSALARSPRYEGTVFRATTVPNLEEYALMESHTLDGFESATRSRKVAEGKLSGGKQVLLVVEQRSGTWVAPISGLAAEDEVILHIGARNVVLNRTWRNDPEGRPVLELVVRES